MPFSPACDTHNQIGTRSGWRTSFSAASKTHAKITLLLTEPNLGITNSKANPVWLLETMVLERLLHLSHLPAHGPQTLSLALTQEIWKMN